MIPASVRIYFWTQKSHRYGTAKDHCFYSAAATISSQNFDWDIPVIVNNVSEVQPSTSDISQLSHQISIFTPPTHPTGKTSTHKSIVCRVWLHYIIWRQKFAIRQKRRHSCESGKSVASKYGLNQHIFRVHDNCPIICEICSKPSSKRQTFATHKIIKHSANSYKISVRLVRSHICQQTPFPGAHVVIILLASPAKVQYC